MWIRYWIIPAIKMQMPNIIEGTCTYVYIVYLRTTGSTAINTGGCSRNKRNVTVARILLWTCGGALAHAFRSFLFAHHIRSQCTACGTPGFSVPHPFPTNEKKTLVTLPFRRRNHFCLGELVVKRFFPSFEICEDIYGSFRRSPILSWAVYSSAKACLTCFPTREHF